MRTSHTTVCSIFLGVLISFGFLFASVQEILAQTVAGIGDYVSIQKNPEFPGPNQDVTVSITSTSIALDSATVSWSVNGVLKKKGVGIKGYTLTMSGLGSSATVSATIAPLKGAAVVRSVVIRPAGVSLIWEALSYTPPFYRGKARNTFDGRVKIAAIAQFTRANGARMAPSDLIYTWKKNDMVVQDASGPGKNIFIPTDPISFSRGESSIEVEVIAPKDGISAKDETIIHPFDPKVLLYENDPLLGIRYEHALSGVFPLTKDEMALVASPYFFSSKARAGSSLNYAWTMNGAPTQNQTADASSVRFRQEGNSGTSVVDLTVKKINALFQEARATLSIAFGQ